jgi:hypothetical protein
MSGNQTNIALSMPDVLMREYVNNIRNVPGVSLFCIREAYFDSDEARKYEAFLPALSRMHACGSSDGDVSVVRPPSKESYLKLKKVDPFMMRTESMFI